jgi:hypothetical protein
MMIDSLIHSFLHGGLFLESMIKEQSIFIISREISCILPQYSSAVFFRSILPQYSSAGMTLRPLPWVQEIIVLPSKIIL